MRDIFGSDKMIFAKTNWKPSLAKSYVMLIFGMCFVSIRAFAQEDPKEIVTAAVRQNGYVCEHPESVEPDSKNTSPGEKAWILHCENGAFRVKFMGDTGASVEPLND
jgi:hypothetical protein